jgi:CHAT domain-containing protein
MLMHRKRFILVGLALLTALLCIARSPVTAQTAPPVSETHSAQQVNSSQDDLLQRSKALYDNEQFADAIALLQQAVTQYQAQQDEFNQAIALSNLSLTHQHLGHWAEAETAIQTSLALLRADRTLFSNERLSVLAQSLQVQGRLQLSQGQAEAAIASWQEAATIYEQLNDAAGVVRNQINQAQALQTLGLFQRAINLLNDLKATLKEQPDSLNQAVSLRNLGEAYRASGNLNASEATLQESLAVATRLQDLEAIAAAALSLGNTTRAGEQWDVALDFYHQAASISTSSLTTIQAQLNQLSLLLDLTRYEDAKPLIAQIQPVLNDLPSGRSAITARINFAHSLTRFNQATDTSFTSWEAIAQLLTDANEQAKSLRDLRTESYALGNLGHLYEQTEQWNDAQTVTNQALNLSQSIRADDISYQWQWQLGRVLKQQNQEEEAIAAYTGAFDTLQALRPDLVSATPDAQFSFRESVEPVYRQLIDLLLQAPEKVQPSQENLKQAREVLESLQVVELENFFRQACLDQIAQVDLVVDQDDPTSAVIYPIVLENRLEVILKLPNEPLYRVPPQFIYQQDLEALIEKLRIELQQAYTFRAVKTDAQAIYNLLVQPVTADLERKNIQNLVFVLDGALRNIPMAALYDGNQYLIEKYGVSVILGLQIPDPQPLVGDRLKVLAAGLATPSPALLNQLNEEFSQLEFVDDELEQIKAVDSRAVLIDDQNFTSSRLQQELTNNEFQIVHLATHGQFGVDRETTFLLASDQPITIDELGTLFRNRDETRSDNIELLILSACETATGDDREVLGIAGTAVRAGARSTIASLWSLDDQASAELTKQLYQFLGKEEISRSQALRSAQIALLRNPNYQHPRYWSPYILVGNWL